MAQKFLNGAEIGAAFQQMRGEGVPQGVSRQMASGRQLQSRLLDQFLDSPRVHPPAANTDEQRQPAVVFRDGKAFTVTDCEVVLESFCGRFAEWNDSLFSPFAEDAHQPLR